jgi:hypothetical protein
MSEFVIVKKGLNWSIQTKQILTSIFLNILRNVLQVRFNNADYNTKIQIKEQLCQIAFPETTPPRPPTEKENESLPFGM